MQRALLPSILASLGLLLLIWAGTMPFAEWEISYTFEDLPPAYHFDISPIWTSGLGEDLLDVRKLFYRVSVWKNGETYTEYCPLGKLNFVMKYAQGDEVVERAWRSANEIGAWLVGFGLIEIVLSGIYIWWLTLVHEHHSVTNALSLTLVNIVFCGVLFYALMSANRFPNPGVGLWADDCHGTFTFTAKLIKIYYEPLLMYILVALLELGTLGVMLRQIIKARIAKRESSKLVVG